MNVRSEISVAGFLICFCIVIYIYLIPTQVVAEGTSPVYPHLINTMLLCFSLAYLVESIRALRKETRKTDRQENTRPVQMSVALRPVIMLLVTGAWVLSLERLGFLVSTFLFLAISSRVFGSKSWSKTLALSVIMPLVIYFIFYGLNSILPEGPLEEMIRSTLKRGA